MENRRQELFEKDMNKMSNNELIELINCLIIEKIDTIAENVALKSVMTKAKNYLNNKNNDIIGILENSGDTFVRKSEISSIILGDNNENIERFTI